MSQTLYRKYRPRLFAELIGQDHIQTTLQNEILNKRVAHAYLFTGPRGVGKTTTARLMAKVVNCENRKNNEAEPCNACHSCREIMAGRSLDIIEIDAASYTQVDHVRESIIPNARTAPTNQKFKVFIIDEVHMLSLSAFNALLKILEEPPAHVIFILATTEVHKIPETIISRCQRFDFKKVGLGDIKKRLELLAGQEKIEVDDEVLELIASSAEGSLRDAEGRLGQIFALGEKKVTLEIASLVLPRSDRRLIVALFKYLVEKDTRSALEFLNKILEEGVDLKYFLDQFVEFLRIAALMKVDPKLADYAANTGQSGPAIDFKEELEKIDLERTRKILEAFIQSKREIPFTAIPQLPLELAIIEICEGGKASLPDLVSPKACPKIAIEEKVKSGTPRLSGIKLEEIRQKWPLVVSALNHNNHSLALILKNCSPVSLEGGFLNIGCFFKFHQERLKDHKNIGVIEKTINDILGENLPIKFTIEKTNPGAEVKGKSETEKDINEVLNDFNGGIVDRAK
ncbi:MAG: DNA polymerase III subunit gamma/tau [Patescibacteria group bacterium]